MSADVLWLFGGVALLIGGGESSVRGATGLARRLGMSQLTVGLTIVAFGTSAPELAVNSIAAWHGRGEISFGNIVGSNMANIGLVVGATALIRPIVMQRVLIRRDLPMMLLATAAAIAFASDGWRGIGSNAWDRGDGILFLMLFGVFLYYTAAGVVTQRSKKRVSAERSVEGDKPAAARVVVTRDLWILVLGLGALIAGAHLSVESAAGVARGLGIPEVIVGLTALAVGTSLPELVASIAASLRGHVGLAIGSVVGSNICNLLFVAGVTATLGPIPVPATGASDLAVLAFLSLVLMGVSVTRSRKIVRTEAILLLLTYLGYLTWRAGFGAQL